MNQRMKVTMKMKFMKIKMNSRMMMIRCWMNKYNKVYKDQSMKKILLKKTFRIQNDFYNIYHIYNIYHYILNFII
jgi:hypothetical protein